MGEAFVHSRREVLKAGALGIAAVYLGACSSDRAQESAALHLLYEQTYLGAAGTVDRFWRDVRQEVASAHLDFEIDPLEGVPFEAIIQTQESQARAKSGAAVLTWWEGFLHWAEVRTKNFIAIDDLVPSNEPEHWLLATTQWQNQLWGAPYTLEVAVLAVNRRLLERAGAEVDREFESYDHFVEALDRLKSSGITPLQAGTSDGFNAEKWLMFEQGQVSSGPAELLRGVAGEIPVDAPVFARPRERIPVLRENYMNPDVPSFTEEMAADRFLAGEAGMMLMYTHPVFQSGNGSEFDVVGFPKSDAPFNRPAIGTGNNLAVTSYGENQAAAGQLIEFLHRPEQSKLWWDLTGVLPADDRFDASVLPPQAQRTWDLILARPGDQWALWWPDNYYPISVGLLYYYGVMQDLFAGQSPSDSARRTEALFADFRSGNPEEFEALTEFIPLLDEVT
jgi:ABC-type glycerol-3-phosphate transport system substrate-binding protein